MKKKLSLQKKSTQPRKLDFVGKLDIVREKLFPYTRLNKAQKYYLLATHSTILLYPLYFIDLLKLNVYITLLLIPLSLGVITDFIAIYEKLWQTVIGKATLLMMYAALTNFAYASASHDINEIIKFETPTLTYTTNFLAFISIPYIALKGIPIILILANFIAMMYLMYLIFLGPPEEQNPTNEIFPRHKENYPILTIGVRLIACIIMSSALTTLDKIYAESYLKKVNEATSWFIYNVEATKYSRCEIKSYSRAIKINDNELIVVNHVNKVYTYTPTKCIPLIK